MKWTRIFFQFKCNQQIQTKDCLSINHEQAAFISVQRTVYMFHGDNGCSVIVSVFVLDWPVNW